MVINKFIIIITAMAAFVIAQPDDIDPKGYDSPRDDEVFDRYYDQEERQVPVPDFPKPEASSAVVKLHNMIGSKSSKEGFEFRRISGMNEDNTGLGAFLIKSCKKPHKTVVLDLYLHKIFSAQRIQQVPIYFRNKTDTAESRAANILQILELLDEIFTMNQDITNPLSRMKAILSQGKESKYDYQKKTSRVRSLTIQMPHGLHLLIKPNRLPYQVEELFITSQILRIEISYCDPRNRDIQNLLKLPLAAGRLLHLLEGPIDLLVDRLVQNANIQ